MTVDERLENWGVAMRMPSFRVAYCAWWAELADGLGRGRDRSFFGLGLGMRDALIVESVWRAMPFYDLKMVLKYRFVRNCDPVTSMRLLRRDCGVRYQQRWRYDQALQKALAEIAQRLAVNEICVYDATQQLDSRFMRVRKVAQRAA